MGPESRDSYCAEEMLHYLVGRGGSCNYVSISIDDTGTPWCNVRLVAERARQAGSVLPDATVTVVDRDGVVWEVDETGYVQVKKLTWR